MFDYHIHSSWSFDAEDSIESIAEEAVQAGLSEICFCEHIDPGHPYVADWDGFIDFNAYSAGVELARKKFPKITIRKGLELGLMSSTVTKISKYVADKDLDFILASQHIVYGLDPFYPEYFEGRTKKQSEEVYLQCLFECLQGFESYSVAGHIGYVAKKSPFHAPMRYEDHMDIIDEILKTIIQTGHGIEINTSGYAVYNEPMPCADIIRRYLQLGGEIFTIGSDAHLKERVGGYYGDALNLLRSLGAKYICTFKNLKPIFHTV